MSCVLCNHPEHEPLTDKGRFATPVKYVVCGRCGLVYRYPPLSQAEAAAIYQSGQYTGDFTLWNREDMAAKNYDKIRKEHEHVYRVRFEFAAKGFPSGRPGRVLEIGPGFGALLKMFQEAGWQAYGVEPDPELSRSAREELGLDVRTGMLETCAELPRDLDLVVMSHVFEHLRDPMGTLERIAPLLRPQGLLFIAVPNILNLYSLSPRWYDAIDPTHVYNFSLKTLAHMLGRKGFHLVHSQEGNELRVLARWDPSMVRSPEFEDPRLVVRSVRRFQRLQPIRVHARNAVMRTLHAVLGPRGFSRLRNSYRQAKLSLGLYTR